MNRRGLTLTELIVVSAVIALLMAVLAPALRVSREKAKSVVCASNIKQLNLAISVYLSNNQTYPYGFFDSTSEPPGGYPGNGIDDPWGWWWFNYIGRFYDRRYNETSILSCPAKNLRNSNLTTNILCGNYGINQSICKRVLGNLTRPEFIGTPLRITEIPKPSETLLIVDSGYSLINWWHVTLNPPQNLNPSSIVDSSYIPGMKINSQKNIWHGQEYDAIGGRHPNRTVNVSFADSHVENKKADELLVEQNQSEYENRIPLWTPK